MEEATLKIDKLEWPEGLLSKEAHDALHKHTVTSTVVQFWRKDGEYILPIERSKEEFEAAYNELRARIERGEGEGINFGSYEALKWKNEPQGEYERVVCLTRYLAVRCQDKNMGKAIGRLAEAVNVLASKGLILGNLMSLASIPLTKPMGRAYIVYPVLATIGDPMSKGYDFHKELQAIVGPIACHEGEIGVCIDPDEPVQCPDCGKTCKVADLSGGHLYTPGMACEACNEKRRTEFKSALAQKRTEPYSLPEASMPEKWPEPREDDKTTVFMDPKKT